MGLFFSLLLVLLLQSLVLSAGNNLRSTKNLLRSTQFPEPIPLSAAADDVVPPTVFFEVTKPIDLPKTRPFSYLLLHHDFAYTYEKPPVLANYTPPAILSSQRISKVVFEWNATCKGRQFDRIFGVWLGGVELLRSCTAEPRATGIVWNVKKDITRYYSLLTKENTLAVYLGNLVDSTYTGIYHVDITMYFYPAEDELIVGDAKSGTLAPGFGTEADLVLPISRELPLNDGLWFEIENDTDVQSKELSIPQNVYRAVLEVYVSFHEADEFWYGNLPNEYIEANNISGADGNGPFREVLVSLDGAVVGAVWPFTVIYTGGVNPLLWRPITGIGSFDLPTYDIEITPFLEVLLDGKNHSISFSVTNALNVWYIDANLHLWLDEKSTQTEAKLVSYVKVPLAASSQLEFKGLDGRFFTGYKRSISSAGWVESSYGNITTSAKQSFDYSNIMVMGNEGNLQIINQVIQFNDSVEAATLSSTLASTRINRFFPFYLYTNGVDQGNGTSLSIANITFSFNVLRKKNGFSHSSLRNVQEGQGYMVIKNNLVSSGLGSTREMYRYDGSRSCYFRNVSSSNYTILYDHVGSSCDKAAEAPSGLNLSRSWLLPFRRTALESSSAEED
ncbi:hypothetical protein MLD38_002290 [Melastoma candidum]|uniref:Uncharacterized protein n=1 Tax=Melastoma candidum TaxID=119954 RepID=A0ACB9SFY6_9MYRT|nr:hypothetical protein MLD38_002290 [Melastoma candidum]